MVIELNQLEKFKGTVKLSLADKTLVTTIQELLIHFGLLGGEPDGIAGHQTLKAFARFKEKEYLENPDTLGETTAIALVEAYKEHPTPVDHSTPAPGEKIIDIPGRKEIFSSQPVYDGSHFTWGEMTKNLSRIPENSTITKNLIRLAQHLDELRDYLGNRAISINSAYRPPAVNRAVGGVSNSRHLVGDAADIVVNGISPHEVYSRISEWHGDRGGLGNSSVFTHIDLRGYRARFKYGI